MNDNITVTLTKSEMEIVLASLPRFNESASKNREAWNIYRKLSEMLRK
jgi:hypothetical protein